MFVNFMLFFLFLLTFCFSKGETCLHYAAEKNQLGCVRVLLHYSANPTLKNESYVYYFTFAF